MSAFSTATVSLPDDVGDRIRGHVRSDLENEVGGVLVGRLQDGVAHVSEVLPALEAVGGAAQLTFTHEVWEEILSTVDREHADLQIVGWYHSHPGHGIFLSSYDQFIHENFFSAPGMLALVVDPRDDDAFGWFGWGDDGLVRLGSDLPVDRPDRTAIPREVSASAEAERTAEARAAVVRDAAVILLAVILVFAVGSWSGRRPLRAQAEQLTARAVRAEQSAQQLRAILLTACAGVFEVAGENDGVQAATAADTPQPTEPPTVTPSDTPTAASGASEPSAPEVDTPNALGAATRTCEQLVPRVDAAPPPAASPDPSEDPAPAPSPVESSGS